MPPLQRRLVAPWIYDFPVTQLLHGLKYEGALANARVLGTLLADALLDASVDGLSEGLTGIPLPPQDAGMLVVPVPLHPLRLQERGYNQSFELARVVARRRSLPCAPQALQRVRATATQVGLARTQRERNLRAAFRADPAWVAGRPVALVDDVVTTGSTAAAAVATLLAAGATSVEVWAVARALA